MIAYIHFTFHSHLLHSIKWSEKQSYERNVLKKADLILMQMPKLGQVKHICQMPVFLGVCRESLGSGVATSVLPYRGLHFGAVNPNTGVLKHLLQTNGCFQPSFFDLCLSLQWEKHCAFALKCGYKRKSLINIYFREYSEAAAYNSSPHHICSEKIENTV